MLFKKTIRQVIALAMLVVFAFSITPQKNIHDFVAKHVDPTACSVHVNLPIEQVEHATVHCSYDQLVATSPFIQYCFELYLITPTTQSVKNEAIVSFFASSRISQFDSHGPPII